MWHPEMENPCAPFFPSFGKPLCPCLPRILIFSRLGSCPFEEEAMSDSADDSPESKCDGQEVAHYHDEEP